MKRAVLLCCLIGVSSLCNGEDSTTPSEPSVAKLASEFKEATDSNTRCSVIGEFNGICQRRVNHHRRESLIYDRRNPPATAPPFDMFAYKNAVGNDKALKEGVAFIAKAMLHEDGRTASYAALELSHVCKLVSLPIGSRFEKLDNPTLSLIVDDVMPSVAEALSSPEEDVRMYAADALCHFHSVSADVRGALKKAARDPKERVRDAAAKALKHFDEQGKQNDGVDKAAHKHQGRSIL